ncbi:DUF7000 family protein [Lapidilactobacillus luobeiensis]|uniref:DUF7000 family protein n=1 Tax=Lapidilactobacillus luobeiensis TaxID=2950371 RepID=UPI0021C3CBD7|nr:hypothetical protein [Lapidilactobacillus luobeiensis]
MNPSINDYINTYQQQLAQGDVPIAYTYLRKYLPLLKTSLAKNAGGQYTFGNVYPGFMDYTYFYFYNPALQRRKLRFGLVLNHREMRFELWLLGQNAAVQAKYWQALKDTIWNKDQTAMPQYAILEVVLVDQPDFNDQTALTAAIITRALKVAQDIQDQLPTLA